MFALEGVDLTAAGTGQQRLIIDLDPSAASGTHRLIGTGGSAFTQPTVGDGVTTASATGLAIGAIAVQGGHATATSAPTVTVNVGGTGNPTSLFANDIIVTTNSVVQVKTSSATDGGGLIGVGDSHANGTADTTSTITVGSDAQLTTLGNVTISSRSELHISGSTDPNIVGFIGIALASTDLTVGYTTRTNINGGISAGATALIEARAYIDGNGSARAEGAGFGADSDADSVLNVNGTTKVVFGGAKQVVGDTLDAKALVEKMRLATSAYTRSTAAGAARRLTRRPTSTARTKSSSRPTPRWSVRPRCSSRRSTTRSTSTPTPVRSVAASAATRRPMRTSSSTRRRW